MLHDYKIVSFNFTGGFSTFQKIWLLFELATFREKYGIYYVYMDLSLSSNCSLYAFRQLCLNDP